MRSCHAGGGKSIEQDKFRQDFEELSVKAVAEVFVMAYSSGEGCKGSITGKTSVCQCVSKHQKCAPTAHKDGKVLGCCHEGWGCVQNKNRSIKSARCKPLSFTSKPNLILLEQTCGAH